MNPYKVTALPPIKNSDKPFKPINGISYLYQSARQTLLLKCNSPLGKLTRRDITEQKIIMNILENNSPVPIKDYSSIRLGPITQRL